MRNDALWVKGVQRAIVAFTCSNWGQVASFHVNATSFCIYKKLLMAMVSSVRIGA